MWMFSWFHAASDMLLLRQNYSMSPQRPFPSKLLPSLLVLLLANLPAAPHAVELIVGNPLLPKDQPGQPAKTPGEQLASVSVAFNARSLGSWPVLSGWNYTMPLNALRKGTGYLGSSHRLRRALRDALNGQPIKVGFLGGSITHGNEASALGVTDWASLVGHWFQGTFPGSSFRNGAVPATPSSYMAMCMEHSIEQDVDIVFIEYLTNDGSDNYIKNSIMTKGYEKLMRRVLALPKAPAVIMMQTWGLGQTSLPPLPWEAFHHSHESAYSALAQYYDAQYLSFTTATNRLHQLKTPGYGYEDFIFMNGAHPNDLGHKMMGDLAVWLVQQTALDLILRPWGQVDSEQFRERLPPPMIPGNEVAASILCLQGASLKTVVTTSEGWQFVNEGTDKKPKTGFISTTPGTTLKLSIDTLRPGQTGSLVVSLGYLRSYQHMGKAGVSCESGCTCEPKVLDGNHTERNSQLFLSTLVVSQHPKCTLAVTVLTETSSGEHKFKVGSMTISDTTNAPTWSMEGAFYDNSYWDQYRDTMQGKGFPNGF